MFRFNRLFWKVFLSLWLSTFAVMMVTVLVIGELAEEDNIKSKIDFKVRIHAERFLERFETSQAFRQKIQRQNQRAKGYHQQNWLAHRKGVPAITIFDDRGQKILGGKKPPKGVENSFKIRSEAGREYLVSYYLQPLKNSLARWQGLIFSIQALLILLSSTIASFIVSAIVVRPMNELRQYLNRLKSGEFSVRVGDKLQRRGDEIGDFAREFNQMAEYVENTLTGQQRLLQNVSHELRAPLARLLAASGIIEQQVASGHPAIGRIQLECQRLNVLIDELLTLARLQQQVVVNAPIDVRPIIEKLLADSHFSDAQRPIELDIAQQHNSLVLGSTALLERALSNILGNTLKHTAENTKVQIRLALADNSTLQIIIEDDGPGVTDEQLARLCEPFYRLDTNVDGHGLGLGIAKQAMQSQQGNLHIENIKPHGLRVTLSLKLAV